MPIDVAKIRELRKKKGLTLQEAAEDAGMNARQSWNRIESGRHPNLGIETLERVAKVLGVKAKDLLK